MSTDKRTPKTETQKGRQSAVSLQHRDKSTDEIMSSIANTNTLITMYEQQRTRCQRTLNEASADMRACGKMLDELRADVSTLEALMRARRA